MSPTDSTRAFRRALIDALVHMKTQLIMETAKAVAGGGRMKLAFIGLGVMGYPMAGHLARAGHAVTVFNRTEARAQKWVQEYGGASAPTPGRGRARRRHRILPASAATPICAR